MDLICGTHMSGHLYSLCLLYPHLRLLSPQPRILSSSLPRPMLSIVAPPLLRPGRTRGSCRGRALPLLRLGRARGSRRGRAPTPHGLGQARARGAAAHLRGASPAVAVNACRGMEWWRSMLAAAPACPSAAEPWLLCSRGGGADGGARRWEERRARWGGADGKARPTAWLGGGRCT